MVTFDQAFANTKPGTRLSIKTKLQARGYDLEGELDDSFMGLQEKDLEAAGLTPPETTALRHVLAKITGVAQGGGPTAAGSRRFGGAIILTPSAVTTFWLPRINAHGSLKAALSPAPGDRALFLPPDSVKFSEWWSVDRQARFSACFQAASSSVYATPDNIQPGHLVPWIPRCDPEPGDRVCYHASGRLAQVLLAVVAVIDGSGSLETQVTTCRTLESSSIFKSLRLLVDQPLHATDLSAGLGDRRPDYAILFQNQGMVLARLCYRWLLQIGELKLWEREVEGMSDALFKQALSQCLDHVGRYEADRTDSGQLPFEISNGLCTRCGIADTATGQIHLGDAWLVQEDLQVGSPALLDKVVQAFYAYKQLQLLRAAAEPGHASASLDEDQLLVASGTLLQVEEEEDQGVEGSNGARTSSHPDTQQQADQCRAVQRHTVQVTATLSQQALPRGGVALVLAGHMMGDSKLGRQAVILRLLANVGLQQWQPQYEQVERARLALLAIRRTKSPYLPQAIAYGVVSAGASVTGAHTLLTQPVGEPLQRYLAYHQGVIMAPEHVLRLAACLGAACLTLLDAEVHHNDINPQNITVTNAVSSTAPHGCMFHAVDFGAASCTALNGPHFRHTFCYPSGDLAKLSPVKDLLFGSLEAVLGELGACLLPLSDLQSVLYTLVFLAGSSKALPWAAAASQGHVAAAVAGRRQAIQQGAMWEGLSVLPAPVARFGAWVLANAQRNDVTCPEVEAQVRRLHDAVLQDLGYRLPLPLPV